MPCALMAAHLGCKQHGQLSQAGRAPATPKIMHPARAHEDSLQMGLTRHDAARRCQAAPAVACSRCGHLQLAAPWCRVTGSIAFDEADTHVPESLHSSQFCLLHFDLQLHKPTREPAPVASWRSQVHGSISHLLLSGSHLSLSSTKPQPLPGVHVGTRHSSSTPAARRWRSDATRSSAGAEVNSACYTAPWTGADSCVKKHAHARRTCPRAPDTAQVQAFVDEKQ